MSIQEAIPKETVRKARNLMRDIAAEAGVQSHLILADDRRNRIVRVRYKAIRAVRDKFPELSIPQIGGIFGRDSTTISYALNILTNKKPKF